MKQRRPCHLRWGAIAAFVLCATVVVAEEGGGASRSDATSAGERQQGWVPPTEGLPGTPSTGFTREKPIISPVPETHGSAPGHEGATAGGTPAEEGHARFPAPTTGPSSSSLPADFGASLTQPGIGATPPRSSQIPRAEFEAGGEPTADDGKRLGTETPEDK